MQSVVANKSKLAEIKLRVTQRWQRFEDSLVPHPLLRWSSLAFFYVMYWLRISSVGGFFVVTYALHLHLLYILIIFLTPISDPSQQEYEDVSLPTSMQEDFKPFVRKMQEHKAWKSMMRILMICFFLTFFSILDIPVFWPILVCYFLGLLVSEMSARIKHMIRFKYVPWTRNKPKYVAKRDA